MASALLDHSLTCIDEDDREICRGSPGDHVACVLHMARGISDDELAMRCREVTIGHIDRDTLLAFGAEAISKVCEIDLSAAGDVGGALEGLDLVLHEGLGVVEKASDQGRLAVINGSASVEAEKVYGMRVGSWELGAGSWHEK